MSHFQFSALPAHAFETYFSKTDGELASVGAKRMTANAKPGFPCRVSLEDAEVGEEVILLPFLHHGVASPYQASGPIFVRKNVATAQPGIDEIPSILQHRLLSIRCYDPSSMMVYATVEEGKDLKALLPTLFDDPKIEYVHVHNAKPGCFNCAVRRAG
jgi:Protein of unknown function (DUF1203)